MKLNYHVFTAKAIEAVYDALENTEVAQTATMYAGTLFVRCNAYSAEKIKSRLMTQLSCVVKVSRVGPEYSFDFV